MRIGLNLPTPGQTPDLETLLDEFQRAEDLGLHSAWMPNIAAFDALTTLALAGRRTRKIELGTFVVPTYPRHPAAMAQQALTTQVACGGRLVLGIGLSHRVTIETRLGLDYSHPIRHMTEYLRCLGSLLAGEEATFQGQEFHLDSYRLTVPGAMPPPVLVAALGPQMLRLTGRLAAGTAIWMGGPRYLAEHVIPTIGKAAREAGRPAPRVLVSVPVCVTDRPEAVSQAANVAFARYGQLPSYRAILDKEGAANPSDVALIGPEDVVRQRLDALAVAGATDFAAAVFAPPGEDAERTRAFLRSYAAGTD
jgi:5,10-methylenetetrahydromethanopterin reductase